jgi:D-alanine-D-alanine ligase
MKELDPDWWKSLFDETYLITDSRSVCDDEITSREVDFLERTLGLKKSWHILDLCGGQGRHSLELSRRGFQNVTVLDYAEVLVGIGRERARHEELHTLFVRSDARDTSFHDQWFRIIILMAGSFGYFADEAENKKILQESLRLLVPGGSLFLDIPDREYVLKNLVPLSWHEANEEIVVCRQRRPDGNVIQNREVVMCKRRGLIRDARYCIRLYSQEEITAILTSVGFDSISVQKNFVSQQEKTDYGCMTNRMIVVARK